MAELQRCNFHPVFVVLCCIFPNAANVENISTILFSYGMPVV